MIFIDGLQYGYDSTRMTLEQIANDLFELEEVFPGTLIENRVNGIVYEAIRFIPRRGWVDVTAKLQK